MGNICRSPMAEGLLRHKLRAAGLSAQIRVDSAGTGGWHAGMPPDPRAVQVCREQGIAIDDLRARQFVARDLEAFDLVLCADRSNLRQVQALTSSSSRARAALLLAWAGHGADAEVPDPWGGTLEDFRKVFGLLDSATHTMLTKLQLPA